MTSIETGHSWSERLNPRNWTLTWKLVVVGLVPALLALVLGVLRVSDQAGAASDLGRSTRLLEVQERVAATADALRQERNEAMLFIATGRTGDRGVLEVGFGEADAEVEGMLGGVRETGELDATTASALRQTEGEVSQLQVLRDDVTDNPADARGVRLRYDEVVSSVDVLDRALLRQLRTPNVAGIADALTAVTDAREQLAVQHTVLGAAIRSGSLIPEDANEIATDSELAGAVAEYRAALTPEQLARFGSFLDDAANAQRERLEAAILATPPGQPIALAPAEWDTAYNGSRAAADRTADLLRNELVALSVAAEEQASNLAGVNSVVLMLGLLIGIAVAVLIARALIRSLRVLRTSALDVAERRLPLAVESMRAGHTPDVAVDPVPLAGRDEVAQVARAFDAVHGQAVRLAADQAALQAGVSAMFVNLSRRSQALVERQLQLIEQLESNEQDADQLSNLFQLDHLATRMRRNSENLLVLAGTDLAKRNIAPVPMVDVLRAAVSEVESYQRIVVQTPPTATVAGRAASDVVHLLAELLDNATNFSPPDSQVVMSTARTTDGAVVVEIADRGVGMAEHELGDANMRLGGPASVDVSASRRMGLFVVGRLAARHGIGVRLSTSATGVQGSGLTASVTVPAHLIPTIEPVEVSRTASLPIAAGTQGGRPGVPPQRGVNGAARTGGLSSLVAGTDGPANPTGVFDAPAGGDGQLFSSPPGSNGNTPSLPSRRPGSTLRPGGPGEPPEGGAHREPDGNPEPADHSAEEQAREVAAQARRDQEAAARAAASRAEESSGRNGSRPESTRLNGHAGPGLEKQRDAGSAPSDARPTDEREPQARIDRQPADQNGAVREPLEQRGTAPEGEAPKNEPTRAGLPRRTPGLERPRSEPPTQAPQNLFQSGPAKPSAQAPAEAEAEAIQARPEPLRPRPAPARRDEHARDEQAQGEQSRQERSVANAEPFAAEPATVEPTPADDAQESSPDQGGEASAQAEAERAAAEQSVEDATAVSPPTMPMPTLRRPAAGAPGSGQPGPRPAPRPTPRPFPQRSGPAPHPLAPRPEAPRPEAPRPEAPRPEAPRPEAPRPEAARPEAARPEAARPEAARPEAARPETPRPEAQRSAPSRPAPTQGGSDAEGLFAPSVPVIAEPDSRMPEGRPDGSSFDLGETTPIFEEIASAWFRSNRPIPVNWQTEKDEQPAAPPAAAPVAPPAAPPPAPPRPAPAPRPTPAPAPAPTPAPTPAPAPAPPTSEVPVTAAEPVQDVEAQEFASTADEGWRAADGAVSEQPDEVTAAGLPKRRPRARLVPGSAGSAVLAPPATPSRSAENIRGRLASYQQGVRQGRESRMRGHQQQGSSVPGANGGSGPANAGGNHDEESS
ncbi:nitrate- and nitrite sensing domain-containing protein [Pseudonocardia sp. MH-G8]|uniref:sensor histidine kinase n=1 Tax=Pseudonocardia sp. MH-G8 TaxID=1854588 RepID=UPI000BA1830E|nr:nitrate- and nitrite sensing domain-containing protein [Pseudonocardia sp. MH-G8]OZM82623.1 hypothetical protein CFP66_07840 [Pseudonocardia sp. MH-G8]